MRPLARPSLLERWDALGRPFPHLSRQAAALVLTMLAAAMVWSIAAHRPAETIEPQRAASVSQAVTPSGSARGTGDMALYAGIHARMMTGEGYYAAALAEQRARGYPTRPFVTVRLPTLAWTQLALGSDGVRWLVLMLAAACVLALNWRAAALGSIEERIIASALLAAGGGAAFSPVAGLDHDFVAGVLLTLALLAYRRARWWPAMLAAAAALAVRELAAPFVLLWLAFALADRRWREAAAVAGVLAVFALGMAMHAHAVDAARLPSDLTSQGWRALAGFGVPIAGLTQLTGLRHLPAILAAPLAILPLLGWAALGGRLGLFATLYFAGIATMMALFARPANYYWAELALPAYAIGLAFAPRGLIELIGRVARQT